MTSSSPPDPNATPSQMERERLDLFAVAPAEAEDGYARWKAEVAAARAAEKAARNADQLPMTANDEGYAQWKTEADAARRAFEQRWGIPLGKRVRVQLQGEACEREGVLRIAEVRPAMTAAKHLRLRLDAHEFASTAILSVVRV